MSNPPTEILNQSPEDLLKWVTRRIEGTTSYAEEFNWHGLAEVAAANGQEMHSSPIWAEISVRIYDWLATRPDEVHGNSFISSAMHVRSNEILLRGPSPGHLVRDPELLVRWFRQNCKFTLNDAMSKTDDWMALPIEEIRELRTMKNCLGPLERLVDFLPQEDKEEIERWIELRSRLP